MTEFTIHTPETAPEGARAILEGAKKGWGFVPNLHAKLAEAPVALTAYSSLFDAFGKSSFTPVEQQVVYLTANVFHECEYCTSGHSALARMAGADAATIEALREGWSLPDARQQALHAFTLAVIENRGRVAPETVDAFIAAGFTKAQVLELLVAIAAKTISNYANHIAGTPLDGFMAGTAWVAPSRRASVAA